MQETKINWNSICRLQCGFGIWLAPIKLAYLLEMKLFSYCVLTERHAKATKENPCSVTSTCFSDGVIGIPINVCYSEARVLLEALGTNDPQLNGDIFQCSLYRIPELELITAILSKL